MFVECFLTRSNTQGIENVTNTDLFLRNSQRTTRTKFLAPSARQLTNN
jgi:hypothetical protein